MLPDNLLREKLAQACRILAMEGHNDLHLGHVSARAVGGIWIKGSEVGLDEVTPDDLILIDMEGKKLSGRRHPHREIPIHTEVMRARPDVGAVVHTHPPYATAFSSLGVELMPVGHEGALFYKQLPVYRKTVGRIETAAEGAELAQVLGQAKAVLLYCHGIVAVGATLEEATLHAILLERAARLNYLARQWGRPEVTEEGLFLAKGSNLYSIKPLNVVWDYLVRRLKRYEASAGLLMVEG